MRGSTISRKCGYHDTAARLAKAETCMSYVPVLVAERVLVALDPAELLDELLPLLFCVTACTIWPAELKTMSTSAFSGEYE